MNSLFIFSLLLLSTLSLSAHANSSAELESFLANSYVPAYDCPAPEVKDTIAEFLKLPDLTPTQTFQLITRKTHALICARDFSGAQQILQTVLADKEADRSARYYLAAIYQYGFIYDVRNSDERCNYYLLAKDSAADQFLDIKTSASLNYATNCIDDRDEQHGAMYELLEHIARSGDKAALAHAYNTIGLFYGEKGHHYLAADQYLKASEIARDIYTNENRLTILTSAMTVLMAANDLERAKTVLDEFIELNKSVNTVQTNFLQYYSSAGFYIRTKEYDKLAQVISKWETIKHHYNDSIAQGLFNWYRAELCLVNQDRDCIVEFLQQEAEASSNYLAYVKKSKNYLSFMVKAKIFIGDITQIENAFDMYEERVAHTLNWLKDVNSVNKVAKFQEKIINLESLLAEQRSNRTKLLIGAMLFMLLGIGIVFWIFRSKLIKSQSYDSLTGLLSNTAVIHELVKLPAPGPKRTNALAIFDIANFTEVNLTVGATKGDFVLKQIANTFKKITRTSDLLGVFGPGRFILCLADIEEDAAQAFFDRAKEALADTFAQEHGTGPVSVDSSMSIYYSTETFTDINEILDNMLLSLSMKSN